MNPANPVSGYFSRIGLNRGRLLTVIVLAATLSGILWAQFRTPVHSPQTTTAVSRPVKLGASPKIENRLNENRVNQSKRSVIAQKIAESQEGFRQEKPNPKQAEATRKNLDSGKLLRPVELGDPVVVSSDPWQEVKLGILEKQDPFALPIGIENLKKAKEAKEAREAAAKAETTRLWVEQQRQAQAKQLMLKLQQEGVRFVLVSGNDRMAQIGSRVVKEGDVIEGVRVAEIRENGSVILEVVDSCDVRVRDDQPDSARR